MTEALIHHLLTLAMIAGFAGMTIGIGYYILNKMTLTYSGTGERLFYAFGLGTAVTAYAVFMLGVLQAVYPAVIYTLVVCFTLIGLTGCRRLARHTPSPRAWLPRTTPEWVAGSILAICLGILFILELTPEIGKDALIYHLAVPKLFVEHHGFYFIEGNVFANYPLLGEMLYIVALICQGDILAKGIQFVFLVAILLGMGLFIRQRVGKDSSPYLAMLVFLSIPSVFITAHMAYNDFFVTYYSMGAVFAFVSWSERNDRGWLILCGLFSGLAVACKYTALLLPFLGVLGVLWTARSRKLHTPEAIRNLSIYLLIMIAVGSPFYIKNWIVTGNPVYPFLFSIFGGRGWDPDQARLYDIFVHNLGMGKELLDYLLLPWNVSLRAKMDSPQFDGILGPVFLFILPFVLGMRNPASTVKLILIYSVCTLIFWAASAQQIRYLIPVIPFLAIVLAFIFTYFRNHKISQVILYCLITASLAFNFYYIARDFQKIRPLRVVFGLENREDFLKRSIPSYGMYSFVNQHLPNNAKVFLIYMKNYGFLCNRLFYADAMFESHTLQKILSSSHDSEQVRTALRKRGFTHMMYDANYVTGERGMLTPQEKQLFSAFRNDYLTHLKSDQSYLLYLIK
jgi:hypothetical protein